MNNRRMEITSDGRPVTYPNNPLTRMLDRASRMSESDLEDGGATEFNVASLPQGGPTVRSASLGQEVNVAPVPADEARALAFEAVKHGVRPEDVGLTQEEVEMEMAPSMLGEPSDDELRASIRAARAAKRGVPSPGAGTQLAVPTVLPDFRELSSLDFTRKVAVIGSVSVPIDDASIKTLRKTTLNIVLTTIQRALMAAMAEEQEPPDAPTGEEQEPAKS